MKTLLVFSVLFLLVALPAASLAQVPPHHGSSITPFSYPSVQISLNQSTSFNLSLESIMLVSETGNHPTVYSATLRMDRWTARYSDHNLSYSSTLFMRPDGFGQFNSPGNFTQTHMAKPLSVHVIVNITRVNDTTSIINTGNVTTNSTLQITYYLRFSSEIPGSGYVVIAQGIAENSRFNFFDLHGQNREPKFPAGGFGRGLVFSNTTTNNTFAAFWWNDTYELNGITENLSSNYTISNHRESLVLFRYNYTDGLKTLFQDPYFTIYGLNIFSYPVLKQDLYRAYNFIIIHTEELVAGMGIGAGIIGVSYASYRRRRF